LPDPPRVWLLDEPFDALDDAGIGTLEALLRAHAASGGAVLLTSHQPLPADLATRVLDLIDVAQPACHRFKTGSQAMAADIEAIRKRTQGRSDEVDDVMAAAQMFSTEAAMRAPCSVKKRGGVLRPPCPDLGITDCDTKMRNSSRVTINEKSSGKRFKLRLMAWLKTVVVTP
jgi:ABC-type sulfate/molybdate transport systems ATPase subunit